MLQHDVGRSKSRAGVGETRLTSIFLLLASCSQEVARRGVYKVDSKVLRETAALICTAMPSTTGGLSRFRIWDIAEVEVVGYVFTAFQNCVVSAHCSARSKMLQANAADQSANGKPAFDEQSGHGSPDRTELAGCAGYEY